MIWFSFAGMVAGLIPNPLDSTFMVEMETLLNLIKIRPIGSYTLQTLFTKMYYSQTEVNKYYTLSFIPQSYTLCLYV